MLERAPGDPCFLCGVRPGPWNEPALAVDPRAAGRQLRALEQRLGDLEKGLVTATELHGHLLAMCSMCQEVVVDVGQGASTAEVLGRLRFCIARLREQARRAC